MHCWQTLEIDPTPDKGEIRRAYARLIKRYRPETHPTEFANIRQAYELALAESVYLVRDEAADREADSMAESPAAGAEVVTATAQEPVPTTPEPECSPVIVAFPPLTFADDPPATAPVPEPALLDIPPLPLPTPEHVDPASPAFDVATALQTLLHLNRCGEIPALLAEFEQQQQRLKTATLDEGIAYESELLLCLFWESSPALEWVFVAASRFGWREQGVRLQMIYGDSLAERLTRMMALADDYVRHVHFSQNPWIARRVGVPSLMLEGDPPACSTCLMQLPLRRWRDEAVARLQGWHRLCDNTWPELDYLWMHGLSERWFTPYRLLLLFALLFPLVNAGFAAACMMSLASSASSRISLVCALLAFAAVFGSRFKVDVIMDTLQASRYWRWLLRLPSPPVGQWFVLDALLALLLCSLLEGLSPQKDTVLLNSFVLALMFWLSSALAGVLVWIMNGLLLGLQVPFSWLAGIRLQLAYEQALATGNLLTARLPPVDWRQCWRWASLRQCYAVRKRWQAGQLQLESSGWDLGWIWKGWLILIAVRALVNLLGKGG